jgi:hypothetical protein
MSVFIDVALTAALPHLLLTHRLDGLYHPAADTSTVFFLQLGLLMTSFEQAIEE